MHILNYSYKMHLSPFFCPKEEVDLCSFQVSLPSHLELMSWIDLDKVLQLMLVDAIAI